MKRHVFRRLSMGILMSVITTLQLSASCKSSSSNCLHSVTPKLTIRSQGTNAARRMAGSVGQINLNNMDQLYGTISITPEYTRSFDEDNIAQCLFGDKLCDGRILHIQGSRVENRDPNALLADYFYLPTDFSSQITLRPLIQNFLIDFNYYLGLDNFYQGMYFWLQAPIVWSRWSLNFNECVIESGRNDHDEGYFTVNSIKRELLLNNFSEYAQGKTIGTDGLLKQIASKEGADEEVQFEFKGLDCAKMCKDSNTKTTISEIRMALGRNFVLEDDYHFGLNLQVSAPTGNNVRPDYLFDVQNGNDNHWELGGGLSFHYILKRAKDVENKHFGFYFDANITHMFKNSQKRCFDLCDKPLSRYMLAAKMGTPDTTIDQLAGNGVTADYQFANEYVPVANLTTFDVKVKVGVQADIVAMLNYTGDNWSGDFGYNFWARSCEQIRLEKNCSDFEENTWVLKGDAQMFGYMSANDSHLDAGDFVALSASMSKATACGGDNFGRLGAITDNAITTGKENPNIDNAQNAVADDNSTALDSDRTNGNQIKTSIQPIFISQDDINFARTSGISHKIFGNLCYIWPDKEKWTPYFGTGFEIEWASEKSNDNCNCCSTECKARCDIDCSDVCNQKTTGKCVRCGVSQWGYWIKAGLSFD